MVTLLPIRICRFGSWRQGSPEASDETSALGLPKEKRQKDRRSPKPGGTSDGSWKGDASLFTCRKIQRFGARSSSNSSGVLGQSFLSSRERDRSANRRPPVWQWGQ